MITTARKATAFIVVVSKATSFLPSVRYFARTASRETRFLTSSSHCKSSEVFENRQFSAKSLPVMAKPNYVPEELVPDWFIRERARVLTSPTELPRSQDNSAKDTINGDSCCVLYWMQRDMRTSDNWALLYTQYLAEKYQAPIRVVYGLPSPVLPIAAPDRPLAPISYRHIAFLLQGMKCVNKELQEKGVSLDVIYPKYKKNSMISSIGHDISAYANQVNAVAVVTDFYPLRHVREWTEEDAATALDKIKIPLYQVDAHNVIPVWFVTDKQEYSARTIRSKINRLLPDFMTHFPNFEGNLHLNLKESDQPEGNESKSNGGKRKTVENAQHERVAKEQKKALDDVPKATSSSGEGRIESDNGISWERCEKHLNPDKSVPPVKWARAGTEAGLAQFRKFCDTNLKGYDSQRNDPNNNVQSNMSPWLNFGHVSFQRLALDIRALKRHSNGTAAYIEEGIVRRELTDNYCFFCPAGYDNLNGAPDWARLSLQEHEADKREYLYSTEEFERGETYDDLWNAAQLQLVKDGKMHGFLRMYWAKKILEWTSNAATALRVGLYLNDKYELDGNDPNGYVGVAWSVMGIHDQGWKERPVFGKVRFMNYNGCKRKFDIKAFVDKYPAAEKNASKAGRN